MLLSSASQDSFSRITVSYITMPGWSEPTTGVRDFAKLPVNAQNYVLKIEELLDVPGSVVTVVSVNFSISIICWQINQVTSTTGAKLRTCFL